MRPIVGCLLLAGCVITGVPGVLLMRACRTLADAARRWA